MIRSERTAAFTTCFAYAAFFGFLWVWFGWTDAWRNSTDLMVDGFGLLLAIGVAYFYVNRPRHIKHKFRTGVLIAWAMFWIVCSVIDVNRSHELAVLPVESVNVIDRTILDGKRVAISLSGGGYRAAVYHAGVIDALRSVNVEPTNLSAVSGGAIFGSFYRLGGDPRVFKNAVVEGRFNLKRELLLIHNLLRLPFPFRIPTTTVSLFPWYDFNRLDVQQALIERTVNPDRMNSVPGSITRNMVINMSDLNFGMQVSAFADSALLFGPRNGLAEQVSITGFRWTTPPSVARLVSYSGAFPGAFPASKELVHVSFGAREGRGSKRELALVDGGVIDNHGRTPLAWLSYYASDEGYSEVVDPAWKSDAIVLSDGGALFAITDQVSGLEALARAFTVSDAYKQNGSAMPHEWYGSHNLSKTIMISASDVQLSQKSRLIVRNERDKESKINPYRVGFAPYAMQPAILKEMAALLPIAYRDEATRAVQKLADYDVMSLIADANAKDKQQLGRFAVKKSRSECERALKKAGHDPQRQFWQAICQAAEVRWVFRKGTHDMLNVFSNTPTLKDVLDEATAETVFNLGKMLTYRRLTKYSSGYPFSNSRATL